MIRTLHSPNYVNLCTKHIKFIHKTSEKKNRSDKLPLSAGWVDFEFKLNI